MHVKICFYSYFKDLTGCPDAVETLPDASTLDALVNRILGRFPKLAEMRKSMLIAVGLEYQALTYVLKDGDEVSLFPPVRGG
jgi:molybdopterin converting factor small subunit